MSQRHRIVADTHFASSETRQRGEAVLDLCSKSDLWNDLTGKGEDRAPLLDSSLSMNRNVLHSSERVDRD